MKHKVKTNNIWVKHSSKVTCMAINSLTHLLYTIV